MFKVFNHTKDECIYDDNTFFADDQIIREPKLTMEANKAGSLSFIMRPGHLIDRHDIIYVTQSINSEDEIIWSGRVLSDARDDYNEKKIECEGALAFMNDSIQPPSNRPVKDVENPRNNAYLNLKAIIDYHNAAMWEDESRKFKMADEITTAKYSPLVKYTGNGDYAGWNAIYGEYSKRTRDNTFENISREFIDRLGGHFRVRHSLGEKNGERIIVNELEYIDSFDTSLRDPSEQTIEFGKNLVSITRSASIDDFATVYIPQGRSLTDVEKTWPYISPIDNATYKLIKENGTGQTETTVSYKTGKYIDSDTGAIQDTANSAFVVCNDIPVNPGEKFFLTSYLEGPMEKEDESKSFVGATSYVVLRGNGEILLSGSQAKNSTDSNTKQTKVAKVEVVDAAITIPDLANVVGGVYLRIARKIDSTHPFALKKFNEEYGEDNVTIMTCDVKEPTSTYPIEKRKRFPDGADRYPASTNPANLLAYEDAKVIYHAELIKEFGQIMKVYSKSDADTPQELYYYAATDLSKMEEKVAIEIKAVDLSFIDKTLPPFRLLDLVHVKSDPHSIDTYLPVLAIELPLESPEKATYTLKNEISVYLGSPSYISQYMAETYKRV